MTREQAILFIDGSNFYHSARSIGIATGTLNYQALAHKLVLDRNIAGIRYYVGKVSGDIFRAVQQEKFLSKLRAQSVDITLGRVERRATTSDQNPISGRLKKLIAANRADLKASVVNEMESLCEISFPQYTEKRVDVSIAVDMVRMAYEDKYDVAYLLSADGDFVPVVEAVRLRRKKVFVERVFEGDGMGFVGGGAGGWGCCFWGTALLLRCRRSLPL